MWARNYFRDCKTSVDYLKNLKLQTKCFQTKLYWPLPSNYIQICSLLKGKFYCFVITLTVVCQSSVPQIGRHWDEIDQSISAACQIWQLTNSSPSYRYTCKGSRYFFLVEYFMHIYNITKIYLWLNTFMN